jgi:hypothetical protein
MPLARSRVGLLEYDQVMGIDWEWLAADDATTGAPLGGPKTDHVPLIQPNKGEAFGFHGGLRSSGRHRARTRGEKIKLKARTPAGAREDGSSRPRIV